MGRHDVPDGRKCAVHAQSTSSTGDAAPAPAQSAPAPDQGSPGHIFWVVPAFNVEYLKHMPPLTPREKLAEWARGAYDPMGLSAKATQAALEHTSSGFCG